MIGAREEHHFVAHEAMPPGDGIGVDRGVGMPHMGGGVDVIDRGG